MERASRERQHVDVERHAASYASAITSRPASPIVTDTVDARSSASAADPIVVAQAPPPMTLALRAQVNTPPLSPEAPPMQPPDDSDGVELSPLLDMDVLNQLTAAIEHVSAATPVVVAPQNVPHPPPQPRRRRGWQAAAGGVEPERFGFAALLAGLDEMTEVASPLPLVGSTAGPHSATR
jgi:hypothetical protein